jgi:hypothetical protein
MTPTAAQVEGEQYDADAEEELQRQAAWAAEDEYGS